MDDETIEVTEYELRYASAVELAYRAGFEDGVRAVQAAQIAGDGEPPADAASRGWKRTRIREADDRFRAAALRALDRAREAQAARREQERGE